MSLVYCNLVKLTLWPNDERVSTKLGLNYGHRIVTPEFYLISVFIYVIFFFIMEVFIKKYINMC